MGKSFENDNDLKKLARLLILEAVGKLPHIPKPATSRKRPFVEDAGGEVEESPKKKGYNVEKSKIRWFLVSLKVAESGTTYETISAFLVKEEKATHETLKFHGFSVNLQCLFKEIWSYPFDSHIKISLKCKNLNLVKKWGGLLMW